LLLLQFRFGERRSEDDSLERAACRACGDEISEAAVRGVAEGVAGVVTCVGRLLVLSAVLFSEPILVRRLAGVH
jgi:hypothetical protein